MEESMAVVHVAVYLHTVSVLFVCIELSKVANKR